MDVLWFLYEHIAKVSSRQKMNDSANLKSFTALHCVFVDVTGRDGRSTLHIAAKEGNLKVVQMIYESTQMLQSSDSWSSYREHSDGEDYFNITDSDGDTPLHLACRSGNADLVHYLVETMKVNIWKKDREGKLALHYAFDFKHHGTVYKLIKMHLTQHDDANCVEDNKTNVLNIAVSYGDLH